MNSVREGHSGLCKVPTAEEIERLRGVAGKIKFYCNQLAIIFKNHHDFFFRELC